MAELQAGVADSGHCLRLAGELSFDTVPDLVRQGTALMARCSSPVVVDLGDVRRTDSAGLALLVEWMREARRQGKDIRFRNIPEQMRALARVAEVESILPLD